MSAPRGLVAVLDELLWALRRAGFTIATSQAIDAAIATELVGVDDPDRWMAALGAIVVKDPSRLPRFEAEFRRFFLGPRDHRSLWERLGARGFSAAELDELRAVLEVVGRGRDFAPLGVLLDRGADLDRLLSLPPVAQDLAGLDDPAQIGFSTHKITQRLGLARAHAELSLLRPRLVDAFGEARADQLLAALKRELEASGEEVRRHVRDVLERRTSAEAQRQRERAAEAMPLASLGPSEVEEVRRAVRRFVERLTGGQRVRARRAARGRVDPHRTMRRALATGFVPLELARRARRRDRPKLLIVCDISDSVRQVARFLLELAYLAQELTSRTRTFVFVSDLGETTDIFARAPIDQALAAAWSGRVVSIAGNSNYGRALKQLAEREAAHIDRRTVVVVLGDGRTNYLDDGAASLDAIRARARALYWLCPEPRGRWHLGDSRMAEYAARCTRVVEVRDARSLFEGARLFLG